MVAEPRPVSSIEEADRVLDTFPQLHNIEKLPEHECWVICRSILLPVYRSAPITQTVTLTDKPQVISFPINPQTAPIAKEFQPPNGTVTYRFEEADERREIHGFWLGAKRVRNCLAFLAGVPIPIHYAMASRRFLFRETYQIDMIMRYHPEVRNEDDAATSEWYAKLETIYPRAERILREISPMAPLGRAISLVGDAIWTSDIEESFLYSWRAIDVIAKGDYSAASKLVDADREMALAPYSALAPEDQGQDDCHRETSVSTKIRVTVAQRAPGTPDERVRELNKLRGTVAHDTVDVDQFRRVLDARWEAVHIARKVVTSAIEDSVP